MEADEFSETSDFTRRQDKNGVYRFRNLKTGIYITKERYFSYISGIEQKFTKRKKVTIIERKELDRYERERKYTTRIKNPPKPKTEDPMRSYIRYRFLSSKTSRLSQSDLAEPYPIDIEEEISNSTAIDGFVSLHKMIRKSQFNSTQTIKFITKHFADPKAIGGLHYFVYHKIHDPDSTGKIRGKTFRKTDIKLSLPKDKRKLLYLANLK